MLASANILVGGVFHAAVLFLVAAGLQLVFGVQKIVNLACGSFYALGAYFGITFIGSANCYRQRIHMNMTVGTDLLPPLLPGITQSPSSVTPAGI